MNQGTVSVGSPSVPAWLRELKSGSGEFIAMLNSSDQSAGAGFSDTIREICQQPATWSDTARNLVEVRSTFAESLASLPPRCAYRFRKFAICRGMCRSVSRK